MIALVAVPGEARTFDATLSYRDLKDYARTQGRTIKLKAEIDGPLIHKSGGGFNHGPRCPASAFPAISWPVRFQWLPSGALTAWP